jgi:putative transposase
MDSGARKIKCCEVIGISLRTLERWEKGEAWDRRKGAEKSVPRKLSEEEKAAIVSISCSKEYQDCNPYEIVAILAEKGTYLASESTMYRVLRAMNMLHHRSNCRVGTSSSRPPELVATGPNQVWSWDITYLKTSVAGMFLYAYAIIDIFSRKIVGWKISNVENADEAVSLFRRLTAIYDLSGVRFHSDNGNPMKGATMLMLLYHLGIVPSFSRPRVSDDNPFIESFFKTVKYSAGYPKCFSDIAHARDWFGDFVNWYNTEHRHSQIGYVTPQQRHDGSADLIFSLRNQTYVLAKERHPERFCGRLKQWSAPQEVYLNPTPETKNKAISSAA